MSTDLSCKGCDRYLAVACVGKISKLVWASWAIKSHLVHNLQGQGLVCIEVRIGDHRHDALKRLQHIELSTNFLQTPRNTSHENCCPLTRMILNTFLAAVTEAWIFRTLPGSPAEMNMQAYCTGAVH